MSSENEDIFGMDLSELFGPVPPTNRYEKGYAAPDYRDVIEQAQNPEYFYSNEARNKRLRRAIDDLIDRKRRGVYDTDGVFDPAKQKRDEDLIKQAERQGMPPRLFPFYVPYSADEADTIAEYSSRLMQQNPEVLQKSPEQSLLNKVMPKVVGGIESLLTLPEPRKPGDATGVRRVSPRLTGDDDSMEYTLTRQEIGDRDPKTGAFKTTAMPEIKLFREKGRQGMPDQTGIRVTKRF